MWPNSKIINYFKLGVWHGHYMVPYEFIRVPRGLWYMFWRLRMWALFSSPLCGGSLSTAPTLCSYLFAPVTSTMESTQLTGFFCLSMLKICPPPLPTRGPTSRPKFLLYISVIACPQSFPCHSLYVLLLQWQKSQYAVQLWHIVSSHRCEFQENEYMKDLLSGTHA
jgi:hypothetical protein